MEYMGYMDTLDREKKKKKSRKREDAVSLQEELRRKLEEQERLRDELEEIRSSHASYERCRDVVDEPSWSETTESLNRERSRTVPPSDGAYYTQGAQGAQGDDIDERYRLRLARLEKMVLTDEQNMIEKEESLRTQLAEKEQLLKKFETELTRCSSLPPSHITKEDKVPMSPGDTPPNNSLSPTHDSPGAAKLLPHNYSQPAQSNCDMFSLSMRAFEPVTSSPTPLQRIAASPPKAVKSSFGTQTDDGKSGPTHEMQTQTLTEKKSDALQVRTPDLQTRARRSNSLRREDYPDGHEGDDMWMRQVESVVQGSAPRKILSPTRTRKVSFSSPPAAFVSPTQCSAFTNVSPGPQPVPEETDKHDPPLSAPPATPGSSRPVSPATPVPDPLTPAKDSSMLSAVCEKIIPFFGRSRSVAESRSITPVAVHQDVKAVEARCIESENKLEHYTLLVKQFEDTVLKLSGCVEKKTAEAHELEVGMRAKVEECSALNAQWQEKYNACNEQWQQRCDALNSEWTARMEQSQAELQSRHSDASAEITRLNGAIRSLCSDEPENLPYAELETKFAQFTSAAKVDMQQREANWREVQERSTEELCRLQGDLAECQKVILERDTEVRSLGEKLAELAKEVNGKEEKIQSLLAKQHQLSNDIEQKQDTVSEMQLTHAQYKDNASSDEIRGMVVELKRDYMKLYEERKARDDQEVKDFYSFCKEQMELKEARLEEARQQSTDETQNLLLRQQSLKSELAELQHKHDLVNDKLLEEQTFRRQEASEYKVSRDRLSQDVTNASAKKCQLEKSLSLVMQGPDGAGTQQVLQLQQEVQHLSRAKQTQVIEHQGIIDALRKELHERELQLSSLNIKQATDQHVVDELEQRNNDLTSTQHQVGELSRLLEEKTSSLQYAEQRMKEEYQRQYHDLQQVQGQFGQYEGEVSVLKAQLAETQAMAEKCRMEMEATQQRADSQETVVRELSKERDTLMGQLEWGSQHGLAQLQAHQQQYKERSMTPQQPQAPDAVYKNSVQAPQNTVPPVPPVPSLPALPMVSPHSTLTQAHPDPHGSASPASPPTMWQLMYNGQGQGPHSTPSPEGVQHFPAPVRPPPSAFEPPEPQLFYPVSNPPSAPLSARSERKVTIMEPLDTGRVSPTRIGVRPPRPVNSP